MTDIPQTHTALAHALGADVVLTEYDHTHCPLCGVPFLYRKEPRPLTIVCPIGHEWPVIQR